MRKLILSIIIVFLCYSAAWAVPSTPTLASGTVGDGNSITLTGTGFGATGPTIQMFDNFESGANGARISDGAGDAAVIGTWVYPGNYNENFPSYSTNEHVSGTKSFRSNHYEAYDCGTDATSASMSLTSSADFYISYWVKIPAGQVIPGTNCGSGGNLKMWWLSTDGGYGSDYGVQVLGNSDPSGQVALGPIDGGENRCAGSYGTGACAGQGYASTPWTRGRWMRMEFYIHGTTANTGSVYGWLMDSATARYEWQSYPTGDKTLDSGSTGWSHLHVHGYARKDNSNTYFDDFYVATGSGARARVELGNNATYSYCTNLAVLTPTSWSDTSITATVRAGSFTTGQTAYLFVVHADGSVSATGRSVTIGSGGDGDTTPPVVTTKAIASNGTTLTLGFSESVSIGTGGNGGWTIAPSGGAATLTYASGSGGSSLAYTISRAIQQGETATVSYTQPGSGVEDAAGNDLASLSNSAVTNSSTQAASGSGKSSIVVAPSGLTVRISANGMTIH